MADLARRRPLAPRVNTLGRELTRLQLGHLVFHERDERADDHGGAAARQAWQLVGE